MNTLHRLLPCLLAASLTAGAEEGKADSAAEYSRKLLLPLVSKPGKDKGLFAKFTAGESAKWNKKFWGASLGFDQFTGIGWGNERAGVLITPEHVLCAGHYGHRPGRGVDFYGEDGRFLGSRAIAVTPKGRLRIRKLPHDIRVELLASPAPAGARIYPLPDPATHAQRLAWSKLPAEQLPLLLATDWRNLRPRKEDDPENKPRWIITRSVHPVRLAPSNGGNLHWSYGPNGDPAIDPSYHELINVGDSSNPIFWVTRSGLVLASTFSATTTGPDYGDPEIQASIQEALDTLGGEKKYTLRTAPVP